MEHTEPLIMQIYCRLEVAVTDPEVIGKLAGRQLREAEIDWSRREEDLEEAVHQLESDLTQALSCVVEHDRMIEHLPGVESRGGLVFTTFGKPDDRFRPGFTDFL
ncbi:hypothetical protein Drose_09590 [Dactylosporangium roseum]|uniref:Uncharacterized protein n=1 Tax=Dactylosporangium roseum TaxID=47989 RepID=A0ABY5Z9X8_9ACTN|nr:hypothetical protein [Dactylosporangium roseum]UWZ38464.1 hypothetical protein Drose_09590 [Dactylosporangium roseum]